MVCERGPVWHGGWNGATAGGLNGLEAGMPEHSCHQGPVLSPGDEIRNSWGPKEGSGSRRFPRRSGRAWPTGRARSPPGSPSLRPAGLVPSPAVGGGPGGSRSSPGPAAAPERRGRGASAGAAPHGGWAGPHTGPAPAEAASPRLWLQPGVPQGTQVLHLPHQCV